jgi:general L-amino acid transport system permease protein
MSELHADTVSFVRDTMLAQQTPPLSEKGAVKWLRENLFSGWLNTLLTLLGIVAVVYLVRASLPWLLHSVWNANSLGECRSVIAATWGDGQTGACWAVIRERWHQFIFGFYPQHLYWRPVLAFVLLLVAIAPVLFLQVSRKLLWFSLVFPAIAFWLLWGGSVWGPVSVLIAFALTALAARWTWRQNGALWGAVIGLVVFLVMFFDPLTTVLNLLQWLAGLLTGATRQPSVAGFGLRDIFPLSSHLSDGLERILPFALTPVDSDQFGGFLLAMVIGVTAIGASLPLGIVLALGRKSDMPLVKSLSVGFIEFIRGVPLITMLFTASLLLQYFLPPQTQFDLILRVNILVTLFAAAYIAEVIRGALAALPRGQYEAADALGLDYWQAQRLIIMPQALKISIPGIVSSFIGLFKDTTLVAFVGLADPLSGIVKIVRADINWKGIYWEPYIFVGAIFFVICFSMSRYSMYLERRLKTDHR